MKDGDVRLYFCYYFSSQQLYKFSYLMFYFTDEAMSQGGITGVRRLRIVKDCACHWCQFRPYVLVIEY